MKVYILTDMEGVAGVLNFDDFVSPGARNYETGRELATYEASAAVEGALDAGAKEVYVLDGHGSGAMLPSLLHPKAKLVAGRPLTYPFGLDESFCAMLIVGQHAKAGTENGHLWHTMDCRQIDVTLNGLSMGELGMNMAFAGWLGVPCVFVSGDSATCDEAKALVPQVETVAVKQGINRGAAVHLHPDTARHLIHEHARTGLNRRAEIPPFRLDPPFEMVGIRPGPDGGPEEKKVVCGDDLIDVLRRMWS